MFSTVRMMLMSVPTIPVEPKSSEDRLSRDTGAGTGVSRKSTASLSRRRSEMSKMSWMVPSWLTTTMFSTPRPQGIPPVPALCSSGKSTPVTERNRDSCDCEPFHRSL